MKKNIKGSIDTSDILKKVKTIISYYYDIFGSEIDFLRILLDQDKIPVSTAKVLRPIMDKVLIRRAANAEAIVDQYGEELIKIYKDIIKLNKPKLKLMKEIQLVIKSQLWLNIEKRLVKKFNLKIYPVDDRTLELLANEILKSDFTLKDIISKIQHDNNHLLLFCSRWYDDSNKHDYDEEWNPEEGNQQSDTPPSETIGMGQGFMIGYTLFYLYAEQKPEALQNYEADSICKESSKGYKACFQGYKKSKDLTKTLHGMLRTRELGVNFHKVNEHGLLERLIFNQIRF